MNIVVTVKQIPDPNLDPELDGTRLKREGVAAVMDEGDEFGVEAALQLAEAGEGNEVTAVSMGPEGAQEAVRKALSMGADRGILISDDALEGADALATAKTLAAAIKQNPFDLVLCAVESTDGYSGIVPQMLSELLEVPNFTFATELEVSEGKIKIHRQTEAGYDVLEGELPAVVTVTAGANEPRYPSFKGIVGAKKKPLDQLSVSDLGLSPDDVAATQSVENLEDAPSRGAGEIVEDEGDGGVRIADFLAEKKVI